MHNSQNKKKKKSTIAHKQKIDKKRSKQWEQRHEIKISENMKKTLYPNQPKISIKILSTLLLTFIVVGIASFSDK